MYQYLLSWFYTLESEKNIKKNIESIEYFEDLEDYEESEEFEKKLCVVNKFKNNLNKNTEINAYKLFLDSYKSDLDYNVDLDNNVNKINIELDEIKLDNKLDNKLQLENKFETILENRLVVPETDNIAYYYLISDYWKKYLKSIVSPIAYKIFLSLLSKAQYKIIKILLAYYFPNYGVSFFIKYFL